MIIRRVCFTHLKACLSSALCLLCTIYFNSTAYAGQSAPPSKACKIGQVKSVFEKDADQYIGTKRTWAGEFVLKNRKLESYLSKFDRCNVSFSIDYPFAPLGTPENIRPMVPAHVTIDTGMSEYLHGCVSMSIDNGNPRIDRSVCFDEHGSTVVVKFEEE